ncbi:superoxide dismutase family protein [Aquisalimonas lutea]|uniref:superoxide dismutase family protein n=1 Tax=Aquisalimonas lutea TaxID=1327750 RepID=UPI0025B380D4|nr:superoxide dismutase family protein [Aquisalimonas lutea]MDN3519674.1 superoxide dismutase family protein [Aquisalimonas lutea]
MKARHLLLVCAAGLLPLAGPLAADEHPSASAEIINTDGESIGEAHLRQGPAGVVIELHVSGLPGGWKAMHIHRTGACDDAGEGFQASGGHVNPEGVEHGFLNEKGPDAGDLPNFYVHDDGTARVEVFNERVSLDGGIMGAAVLDDDGSALVIHESRDDHRTQPIGGAGSRLACGVIEAD